MHRTLRQTCVGVMASLCAGLSASVTFADELGKSRESHDIAREALERGEILPLETVLSEVRKAIRGEVVGVELEREHGTWVYEIKIIASGNRMIVTLLDARTAKLLESRDK
jgi:uncharacterized membrane protein YkoI